MKYYGNIGFSSYEEIRKGVAKEVTVSRPYYGDVIRLNRRWDSAQQLNDNINVNNSISILSDPYATENFMNIRWVEFMGSKWKVTNVELQHPRLILTIGGLFNDTQS